MKKQTFTKQAVWQAAAVGVLAVGGVLFAFPGQIGIGQTYRQVRVDDRIIGYAPENTDMDDIVRQARQELTQKTGERISGEVVWSSEECRKPFQKLLSENELKEAVENILSEKNARKSAASIQWRSMNTAPTCDDGRGGVFSGKSEGFCG